MSKGPSYIYTGTKGHIIDVAQNLPGNPEKLLDDGWEETSNPHAAGNGHREFTETETGLKIRFDEGKPGSNGYGGKDHYHVYNPDATGNRDLYLDSKGEPARKGSSGSHIFPNK